MWSNMLSADFSSSSNYLQKCVVEFDEGHETSLRKNVGPKSVSVEDIPLSHFGWTKRCWFSHKNVA